MQDLLLLTRGIAAQAGPEYAGERGVVSPQLLDGKVAAEHAPAGAEQVNCGLDDRLPFVQAAAAGEGAQPGQLYQDVGADGEAGQSLAPERHPLRGSVGGHAGMEQHEGGVAEGLYQAERQAGLRCQCSCWRMPRTPG